MFVVVIREQLRDGVEESAKLFESKNEALQFMADTYSPNKNMTMRLFHLGAPVPVLIKKYEEQQLPKLRYLFVEVG